MYLIFKNIFFLIIFIFWTTSIFSQNERGFELAKQNVSEKGETYVIIIGISEYPNLDESKQLNYADDDAEMMFNFWINNNVPDTNIFKFINHNAGSEIFHQKLYEIIKHEAKPNDLLVIYFAGHGDVDNEFNEGYFLFSDVIPSNDWGYDKNDAYSFEQLKKMINWASNKKIKTLVLADACRSGIVISNANNTNYTKKNLTSNWSNNNSQSNGSISKIVSCNVDQKSFEGIKWSDSIYSGHGVFTYFLINGLKGLADLNDDNLIDFEELSRYTKDNVGIETNKEQTPKSSSDDDYMTITNINNKVKSQAKELTTKNNYVANVSTLENKPRSIKINNNISKRNEIILRHYKELLKDKKFTKDVINPELEIGRIIHDKKYSLWKFHEKLIEAIDKTSDGNYTAIGSHDNKITIVEGNKFNVIKILKGHTGGIRSICFSPNNKILVSGGWDNSIILWDYLNGKIIKKINNADTDDITALNFTDNNTLISGSNKGNLIIWNLDDGTCVPIIEGCCTNAHSRKISDIEIINKKLFFTSSYDGTIKVWDSKEKKLFCELKTRSDKKTQLHGESEIKDIHLLNYKNQLLSIGDDGKLKIWDLYQYPQEILIEPVKQIEFDYKKQNCFTVDPSENFCFIGSNQYKLKIFNLNSLKFIEDLSLKKGTYSINYDPINNFIELGDFQGRLVRQQVEILSGNTNAFDVHNQLIKKEELNNIKHQITGSLILGLNKQIAEVLYPLINGDVNKPKLNKIEQAHDYSELILDICKNEDEETYLNKLKINNYLLKIFIIIEKEDYSSYERGLEMVEDIKKIDSKGAYIYNINGILLNKLNLLKEAKIKATETEAMAPLWAEAPCNFGKILVNEKNYEEAEKKFLETIKKGPKLSKGYLNLGELFLKTGRINGAEINLKKAYEIDDSSDVITYSYARILHLKGQTQEAIKILQNAKYKTSKILELTANIKSLSITSIDDLEDINELYMTALSMTPKESNLRTNIGVFYQKNSNHKDLKKFIENKQIWKYNDDSNLKIKGFAEIDPLKKSTGTNYFIKSIKINGKKINSIIIDKWLVSDGDFVKKGEPIFQFKGLKKGNEISYLLENSTNNGNNSFTHLKNLRFGWFHCKAEKDGYISILKRTGDKLLINEDYCYINDQKSSFKIEINNTHPSEKIINNLAIYFFNDSKRINKNNLKNYLWIWLQSKNEKSIDRLNDFIKKMNYSAEAYCIVGRYFHILEKQEMALKFYKKSIKRDKFYMPPYLNIIEISSKNGDKKTKSSYINKLTSKYPKNDVIYNLEGLLNYQKFL